MQDILQSDELAIVDEGESANVVCTFSFEGEAFDKAALLSLTITLYDNLSGDIINSRNSQNVLDANGGIVTTEGELTLALQPADNAIQNADLVADAIEEHILRFAWTWNDGLSVRTGREEFRFGVRKLREVTA